MVLQTTEGSKPTPTDVVQAQLVAYNARDLEGFIRTYADDVILAHLGGEVILRGVSALRTRYESLFKDFPHNHAEILYRVELGNHVIDHEIITRTPGTVLNAVAIYMVQDGLILRVDFVR